MLSRQVLKVFTYSVAVVMLLPLLVVLPVALTTTEYMTFPPIGLTLKWFAESLQDKVLLETLFRSAQLAFLSASSVVVIGLLASLGIQRGTFRGKDFFETFFTSPRIAPLIIFVLGVLIFYHSIGLVDSFVGLLMSHLVITFPFAFRTLLASVASLDESLEWSAKLLGANIVQTYSRVVFPHIKTGLLAAFLFSFITSFNNVTVALFLSAPGQRTFPVELFFRLQVGGVTPKVPAISFILAAVGIIVFIIVDRTLGVFKYLGGEH